MSEPVTAEDIVSFHVLYTQDSDEVLEAWIDADSFKSAERIFTERFPCAGWYEIGAPLNAIRVCP